jgi:hypothetical protein
MAPATTMTSADAIAIVTMSTGGNQRGRGSDDTFS